MDLLCEPQLSDAAVGKLAAFFDQHVGNAVADDYAAERNVARGHGFGEGDEIRLGQFALESVSTLPWNDCPLCRGIGVQVGVEYAPLVATAVPAFSAVSLKTRNFRFDRDEANAR